MARNILITGGAGGIGIATASRFVHGGDNVIVTDISDSETLTDLRSAAAEQVSFYPLDVSKESACAEVVDQILQRYVQIDVLVNIAGVGEKDDRPFLEKDFNKMRRTLDVNLMGTIIMSMTVAKAMVEKRDGVIINVSSIAAHLATTNSLGYSASKAGVDIVTKIMSEELSGLGIRCLAIAPATVRTRMMDPAIEDRAKLLHMKRRVIEPEESASSIYLLSLKEASAVGGTTVMTDDGYCAFINTVRK